MAPRGATLVSFLLALGCTAEGSAKAAPEKANRATPPPAAAAAKRGAEAERLPPGEGLRRAFGTWAEDAEELDQFLEWNRQQRQLGRREIEE